VSRFVRASIIAAAALCRATGAFAAPPVDDFFRLPKIEDAELSPAGDALAFLVPGPGEHMVLATLDLRTRAAKVVAAIGDADVRDFYWVNDQRLAYDLIVDKSAFAWQHGKGLYAVNRDGTNPRRLIKTQWELVTEATTIVRHELDPNNYFQSVVHDGSADVIVRHGVFRTGGDLDHIELLRLDTNTGRWKLISRGAPPGARRWLVDDEGVPRALVAVAKDRARAYWWDRESGTWSLLREFDRYLGGADVISPWYVDDANHLYVRGGGANAEQTAVLYLFDVKKKEFSGDPVVSIHGFDFNGQMIHDPYAHRTLGVRYVGDARGTAWFDESMKKLQSRVDALLPATLNEIRCTRCIGARTLLVRAWSDRQPALFLLYDPTSDKLETVGRSRPWIDPRQMARRAFTHYAARDGLSVPAYVTRPNAGKGPWPTVILVHGGPWVRGGTWEWDGQSQFLASRGYLVVEPEFRGSRGFGYRHFKASWHQWGLAMEDDLADAASWAVAQHWADPKRICIAGASYGGYAALMGLVRYPNVFRCAVDLAGVTDINLMYSIDWSDLSDDWKSYGMPALIGDPVKDAAQLAATSPLKQAARIHQPVLLAYGGEDRRVPFEHGVRFRDAVRKSDTNVEWLAYSDEGHGFALTKDKVDFWRHVEAFLDKYLAHAR